MRKGSLSSRVLTRRSGGRLAPPWPRRPVSCPTKAARAQEPPKLPTFPSQVELITVDAVVVDKDGRPVPGLTKDDFVVKEDSRARRSRPSSRSSDADAPVEPPAVAERPAPGRGNSRAFSLLVDDASRRSDRGRARGRRVLPER